MSTHFIGHAFHRLLTMIELARPRQRTLGIEILIETTKGLANVEAIAARGQAARIEFNATYEYSYLPDRG